MAIATGEIRAEPSILRPVLVAVLVHFLATYVTAGGRLTSGLDDTDVYYRYAIQMRDARIPYREYVLEYPVLALPLFLVPVLISRDVTAFKILFAIQMLLFNVATVWSVAAWVERRQGRDRVGPRLARYTVLYLLLSRLIASRYDAAVMFVGFAASCCWFSDRCGLGGFAAGLGTLMKVYPAVVAMVAAPWDTTGVKRKPGRGTFAFAATLLLGVLAWLTLGGMRGVAETLKYQIERGIEYGSLYSGLQMLAAKAVGARIAIVRDHAAWASVTPWTPQLMPFVLPIQGSAILIICVVFVVRGMTDGVRYSGTAILAFIITGKVFSPQYLIWMMPFVAVLEGPIARRGFWLFALGCAATLVAPALTSSYDRASAVVILAYNLKNAVFLVLLFLLTFGPASIQSRDHRVTQ